MKRIDDLIERKAFGGDELRNLAHSLAGAAGTFGFPDISAAAGECDDAFAQGLLPEVAMVERLAGAIRDTLLRATE